MDAKDGITTRDNDNPELVRRYEAALRDKTPHLAQAYLRGDWSVTPERRQTEHPVD